MSATLPNSDLADTKADVIWSRGGGSFGRLVWKELNEAMGVWGVIALATLCSAALIDRRPRPIVIESVPVLWLHAAPALFALIFGARAFAQEFAGGTWELLKSVNATALEVVGTKWLVGIAGSMLLMLLSIVLATVLRLPLRIADLGEPTVWYLLVVLLSLALSLLVSQWSRSVWRALALSGAVCLPLWGLWGEWFDRFYWVTSQLRWQCNTVLSLAIVALPAVFAMQMWAARWNLLDSSDMTLGFSDLFSASGAARRNLLDRSDIIGSRRWKKVFWRMVWKEVLVARDFWLSVLGIVALLDGLAWWAFRDAVTRDSTLVVIGVLLPVLHSLGCGAISFAIEREDGTHDWLRRISAPAGAVFAAKLLVSQASIVTLTSVVFFATQSLARGKHQPDGVHCWWLLMAVTLNGLVSLGASMLTRRVLPAVFLAFVGGASIGLTLLTMAMGAFDQGRGRPLHPEETVSWCLLVGSSLLLAEIWMSERWINEQPWWKKVWRGDPAKLMLRARSVALFEQSSLPEMKAFGRMLWREWHEARVWLWMLPIAFAPWLMNEVSHSYRGQYSVSGWHVVYSLEMSLLAILSIMLTMLPTLWGVWAIHHDQRHGLFRFLSDRGGSPTGIWLSKHAVWLPQVLLLALIAGCTLGFLSDWQTQTLGFFVGFALVGALQGYAAGQWLAQLIRSPLTSLFLASVLSLLLAGWSMLLWEIHAPWLYQLVPAATLLLASWVHARDWLEERWTWRVWLKIVIAVLLPAAELVLALEVQGYPLWKTLRDWPAFR